MKVLFICTGNTCRSPMAEGIFNKIAKEKGIPHTAFSAGLYAGGQRAGENAVKVMKALDIDIGSHVSRGVNEEMLHEADLILTMTSAHKDMLSSFQNIEQKIFTLGEYTGKNTDISDPFGQDEEVYSRCAKELEERILEMFNKNEN